ncbi:hypothetical protein PPERSA_00849 [Pseudocohnilembus persalinus]|uniref:CSC1/OSCA1-like cytosolic domain-containing protein n=1 Tax=Pseudocohnilembus persalinus TaxID=266149 RepID=A0A0V0QEH7_PSEPJ|nr:hypothetical protein PPERSA_00849 [Pseudocohnilembus persalinus]|eukprot:KRX00622.1 hypothetical protein PPERSA_00849 [Pseudocohnilembus persalinus]
MKLNVYSVHLARQYNDTLFLHIKSNELRRKYKENLYLDNIGQRKKGCLENCFPTYFNETLLSQKRYLKVIKKNNEIILNTFSQVKYHDDYNSLKAFVVFDTINDKKKAHQFFKKKYVSNWKLQCCPKRYNKQFMLFEKYSIKSSESVSQPSDILWENIEVSSFSRFFSYNLCTYEEFMDEKLSNQDCEKAFYEFLVSLVLNTMIGTIIWITNTLMRLHFVIFGFSLPETLSESGLSIKEDGEMEYFESLNQNFYIQSGSKLIIALVCTAFFFFINFLFGEKLMRKQKLNKAKKLTYKDQMKKILSPKPFDLAYAYSSVLNTIFVTLLYSSGMPIMIPIGAISLLIQYWSFKQSILRYKRKPPEVDTSLHDSVLTILPFSILFHLAFALFVYSEQSILPIPSEDTTKDDVGYLNTYATKFSNMLGINSFYDDKYDNVRMLEQNQALTLYIFICIVLTVGFLIIAKYLTTILRILKKIICCGRLQPNAIFNFSNQSYEALFDDMNKKLLPSYDIMDNLEYKGLIQTLNIGVEIDQMENDNNENNSQQTFLNN